MTYFFFSPLVLSPSLPAFPFFFVFPLFFHFSFPLHLYLLPFSLRPFILSIFFLFFTPIPWCTLPRYTRILQTQPVPWCKLLESPRSILETQPLPIHVFLLLFIIFSPAQLVVRTVVVTKEFVGTVEST